MMAEQSSEHDPDTEPDLASPQDGLPDTIPSRSGGLLLIATSLALLIAGTLMVQFGLLVDELMARSVWLGTVAAAVFVLALGLCAVGIWRETAGLFSLKSNQWWREELSDTDTDLLSRKRIATKWLRLLGTPRAAIAEAIARVQSAQSGDEIEDLLRDMVADRLESEARRLSHTTGYRVAAAKLLLNSPALESLVFLFFTLRLLRQIGELHGLRPGTPRLVAALSPRPAGFSPVVGRRCCRRGSRRYGRQQ